MTTSTTQEPKLLIKDGKTPNITEITNLDGSPITYTIEDSLCFGLRKSTVPSMGMIISEHAVRTRLEDLRTMIHHEGYIKPEPIVSTKTSDLYPDSHVLYLKVNFKTVWERQGSQEAQKPMEERFRGTFHTRVLNATKSSKNGKCYVNLVCDRVVITDSW